MADANKLVINLSSIELTKAQVSVLSKGLSFCPTPGEPDLGVLKEDMERFHRDLRRKAFCNAKGQPKPQDNSCLDDSSDEGSIEGSDIETPAFKHYKFKPKSRWNPPGPKVLEDFVFLNQQKLKHSKVFAPANKNLSKEEQNAIKELQDNRHIVIKPADKGGAVVVMNLNDYLAEGHSQLSDTKVYVKLDECKTFNYHELITKYLRYCFLIENEINKDTFLYLTDFKPRTSRLYLLPKIHKEKRPPPCRPVISANGSPTERISEFVDFFLKPYVAKTKSYIKDTTDFLTKLKTQEIIPISCLHWMWYHCIITFLLISVFLL